jgi:alcohol dehydrogenase
VAALGRRALLVTDPGLQASGHVDLALAALGDRRVEARVAADVETNPTDEAVARAATAARAFDPDVVVALGGGTVMDSAKAINFLLTNAGAITDYWGYGKARSPLLPAVAVPATAGTGSDAQSFAVIADARTGRKMACGDPSARFRTVILDPSVASTAPPEVVATAGVDALSHAVESYVSTRATPVSRLYAAGAWRTLRSTLADFFAAPARLEIAGQMLLAAHLAGAAIEGSMLGAAHATANPLTARFRITHGVAVALMLPQVVRFNAETADGRYRELVKGGGEALASELVELRRRLGLAETLRDVGVPFETLAELATLAAREWTGSFNPRPLTHQDFLSLYEKAY